MTKAIHPYEVLRRPVVTEKSTMLAAQGKYVFEVHKASNKHQIKEAVERAFSVTVTSVNTSNERGRRPRRRRQKPPRREQPHQISQKFDIQRSNSYSNYVWNPQSLLHPYPKIRKQFQVSHRH